MAHIAANMIAGVRAQFADEAHHALRQSHGHYFSVHQPKPQPRPRPPPPRRELAEMMDLQKPPADPEAQIVAKQQKIAAHNARITAINNSKTSETKAPQPAK